MKVIRINTPEGQFEIDLETVAEDRAEYYAEKNNHSEDSMEWMEDVETVMDCNYEGIDWIINNSEWEDWEPLANKINDEVHDLTDEDFWSSSDNFEITDI